MSSTVLDRTWIWHPSFQETRQDTAGLFVHFRRTINIPSSPLPDTLPIHITADTRYRLYVNGSFVAFGPVKGDQHMWFYDEVDIAPYLKPGENLIAVVVLRFFYATQYAPSLARLPSGGLRIVVPDHAGQDWVKKLHSSAEWETAVDHWTTLRVDEPEDRFLHVYERLSGGGELEWEWESAKELEFRVSTGNSTPWHLCPRMIPEMRVEKTTFCAIHNLKGGIEKDDWEAALLGQGPLCLPPESVHQLDLEFESYTTAFVGLVFGSQAEGEKESTLTLTYAESYEDKPVDVPDIRRKGMRRDCTKSLYGPKDIYEMKGISVQDSCWYNPDSESRTVIRPFHWRSFRFMRLRIEVGSHSLALHRLTIDKVNYPLDVLAEIDVNFDDSDTDSSSDEANQAQALFTTSIRTLLNCMHDSYEDCPFYEQLQYAMDVRSSALFTYYLSGDDRLARQAIVQLRNSFQARIGLTLSRSPTHRPQVIPHFSLFWVLTVYDHLLFFGDRLFTKQCVPIVESVLAFFEDAVDPELGLVRLYDGPGVWNFIDWVPQWKPHGVNPVVSESGVSTYTNNLYAYTLARVAEIMETLGLPHRAEENTAKARAIIQAIRKQCFNGEFFTDTITAATAATAPLSQHAQVWSVLSGAATGPLAVDILRRSLAKDNDNPFIQTSTAMSFYTARALSLVSPTSNSDDLYTTTFNPFWTPWLTQLNLDLTTWREDAVSERSDCHAWGCVPIYEFLAEVAGLRPLEPGWKVICFAPRVGLYNSFRARVPFYTEGGVGIAGVEWMAGEGGIQLTLGFTWAERQKEREMARGARPVVSVVVRLPGREDVRVDGVSEVRVTV
ncbi:uncharacterized protein DSM5745_06139 [Aspergillus mulundensis]|uniref:Alpha-L-rhamnosidase six-hairpin glycosidase domain-containing protein n=1 Tax=Aspergillus mulundensis TaxID=1810919 RepID=A0A3D8RYZ8_9EURO|nr:Uncharacterized protein DSM5745_06139 [Aspergillus mulundensis]RDW79287.1 Uncharacterized protein DSM5745_06139 [Aspergillus mulundensis]